MAGLKKWGVVGALATGLVIPSVVAVNIALAPRSPAELHVPQPAPAVVTQPFAEPPRDVYVPPSNGAVEVSPPVPISSPATPPAAAPPTAPPPTAAPPTAAPPTAAPPTAAPPSDAPPAAAPPTAAPPSDAPPAAAPPTAAPPSAAPPAAAPPTAAPPAAAPAPVEQRDVVAALTTALDDGSFTAREAKAIVRVVLDKGAAATPADWAALASAWGDARTGDDARAVLDATFVRHGVPQGAGAAHIEAVVLRATMNDALGRPLRGRLNTQHLLHLSVPSSSALPRGAMVWVAPGTRPQAFVELPGVGTFGPLPLGTRGSP